jgi:hypothetical protein
MYSMKPLLKLRNLLGGAVLHLSLACSAALAQDLSKLDCGGDQSDRRAHARDGVDWQKIAQRDAQRQRQVLQDLKLNRIRRLQDYHCASLILLHAGDEANLRLSFALAVQAQSMFPGKPEFNKLAARAWDRLMMARQQPQWFGTQFEPTGSPAAGYRLYPLAAGLMSEAERSELGGLSDAGIQAELLALNSAAKADAQATPVRSPTPPAAAEHRYTFKVDAGLLLQALDVDASLANFLALAAQSGLKSTGATVAALQGRRIFIPRSREALRPFLEGQVSNFPRAEGSATPVTATGTDYKVEGGVDGLHRMTVGIDDAVQAAATMVVRPSRYFELLIEDAPQGQLVLKKFSPLPQR